MNFSATQDAILVEKEFQLLLKEVLSSTEWKECLFKLEDTILSLASAVDCVGILCVMPIRFKLSTGETIVYLRYFEHGGLEGIYSSDLSTILQEDFQGPVFPMKMFNLWDVQAHRNHIEKRKLKEG